MGIGGAPGLVKGAPMALNALVESLRGATRPMGPTWCGLCPQGVFLSTVHWASLPVSPEPPSGEPPAPSPHLSFHFPVHSTSPQGFRMRTSFCRLPLLSTWGGDGGAEFKPGREVLGPEAPRRRQGGCVCYFGLYFNLPLRKDCFHFSKLKIVLVHYPGRCKTEKCLISIVSIIINILLCPLSEVYSSFHGFGAYHLSRIFYKKSELGRWNEAAEMGKHNF